MKQCRAGFALIVTVSLLAVLILTVFALSTLVGVGLEMSGTAHTRMRARQNALLALGTALGELRRHAARDDARTGMAGMTGVPAGQGRFSRHWCGVWGAAGDFRRWLVSGGAGPEVPVLTEENSILVAGSASLGADGTDKEHVRVPRVAVPALGGAADGYAWWVADEGVKLSACLLRAETPLAGQVHAIDELIPTLSPNAADLPRVLAFSQLAFVPSPTLTPGQLQANFHSLTVVHRSPPRNGDPIARSGLLNINTTSTRFWRALAASYNRWRAPASPVLNAATFGVWMRDHLAQADPSVGKSAGAPYPDVGSFLRGEILAQGLEAAGGRAEDFRTVMLPWLTMRSDTFRIRAYGDAADAPGAGRPTAVAWCEAIVQRVKDNPGAPSARFVVLQFRWLGPEDI